MRSDLDARDRAPLWINDDDDDNDDDDSYGITASRVALEYLEEEEEMGRSG